MYRLFNIIQIHVLDVTDTSQCEKGIEYNQTSVLKMFKTFAIEQTISLNLLHKSVTFGQNKHKTTNLNVYINYSYIPRDRQKNIILYFIFIFLVGLLAYITYATSKFPAFFLNVCELCVKSFNK